VVAATGAHAGASGSEPGLSASGVLSPSRGGMSHLRPVWHTVCSP
jgi:hypothetical protein